MSVVFVAKILQRLVASRLVARTVGSKVASSRRDPRTVSVLDIITALHGPLCLNECLPGGPGAKRQPVAARWTWKRAQAALSSVLASETLDRLAVASKRGWNRSRRRCRSR